MNLSIMISSCRRSFPWMCLFYNLHKYNLYQFYFINHTPASLSFILSSSFSEDLLDSGWLFLNFDLLWFQALTLEFWIIEFVILIFISNDCLLIFILLLILVLYTYQLDILFKFYRTNFSLNLVWFFIFCKVSLNPLGSPETLDLVLFVLLIPI